MFEFDVRLWCDRLCKVGECFCFAVFVEEVCLNVMLGYVVIGYVKIVLCVLPLLND